MLTQSNVDAINKAFHEALDSYNSNAKERVVDSKSTFSTLAQYLKSEAVEQVPGWTYKQVWMSAIVAVQDRLEKVAAKSREQLERERRAADAAPGRQRYIKNNDGHKTTDGFADLTEKAQKSLQNLFNPEPEKPEAQETVQWPTLVPYEQMDGENKKLFRALSVEHMKAFMKKLSVSQHRAKYNLDPVEE